MNENIIELVKNIAPIIIAIISTVTIYMQHKNYPSRLSDDYKLTKEILNDLKCGETHPLITSKGYQILSCGKIKDDNVMKYLLTFHGPFYRIYDYICGMKILNFDIKNGESKFKYKKPYCYKNVVSCVLGINVVLYFLSAAFAFSPFLIDIFCRTPNGPSYIFLLVMTLPLFGMIAVFSLFKIRQITSARTLIKIQDEMLAKKIDAVVDWEI